MSVRTTFGLTRDGPLRDTTGALAYQHGRIDCELIATGETKMQRSAYGLIVLLTLTAIPLSAEAAPAQADRQANCVASVDAIRAEWRKLSH